MARLAYVILAHGASEPIVWLAELLRGADETGHVVIHYDAKSPKPDFEKLQAAFRDQDRVHLVPDRVVCGWGQFGLVDGVVRALRVIRDKDLPCDHAYLLSGSCLPVRPLAHLKRFLDQHPAMEFIEAETSNWIVGGLKEERYQFRHWFSHLTQRKLFDLSVEYQRRLGFKRRFPRGLVPRFGSQWWCLTTKTCYGILDYIDRHPSQYRFFKTTFIPDEMFFQSLAFKLAGAANISGKALTYYEFSYRGKPTVFFDDSIDVIDHLPYFFARKINPRAKRLLQHLAEVAAQADDGAPLPPIGEPPPGLSFSERVSKQTEFPTPGQIFYGDQRAEGWPGVLGSSRVSFAVLYGPPGITGMVIEALRNVPELSLFGRVFKPDEVDFGPSGPCYEGLRPDDIHIRAMDKPLYLSRVLERATGFPIIQISPGDDRDAEGALWHFKNAVFIPCVPRQFDDKDWRNFYWALTALANPKSFLRYLDRREVKAGNYHVLGTIVDRHIEEFSAKEHRDWVTSQVFNDHDDQHMVHLYFDTEGRELRPDLKRQRQRREKNRRAVLRAVGPTILPLLAVLDNLNSRFATLRPEAVLALLPAVWRPYFRVLLEPSPQQPNHLRAPQLSVIGRRFTASAED